MRIERIHLDRAGIHSVLNICTELGDVVEFHSHEHAHLTQVLAGKFRERVTGLELASFACGHNVIERAAVIEAGAMHAFDVLELENGVAAFECLWPGEVK